ncbi:hypothetical protein M758_6G021200 [Ceratodon purpureus]|nr:hypothetical protein M758_6G021200 [Ceratodon purpureus]
MKSLFAFLVLALVFGDGAVLVVAGCCDYIFNTGWEDYPLSGNVTMEGDVQYNTTEYFQFELNYQSYTKESYYEHRCGRIRYKNRIRMVDRGSGRVASFNTSFTFEFQGHGKYGLALTFVSSADLADVESTDRWYGMCAFDAADTRPSNNAFAVTFDSFQDHPTDPSDSSIGVIISNRGNTTATYHNLCARSPDTQSCRHYYLDPFMKPQGETFTVAIMYDDSKKSLDIFMDEGGSWYVNGIPRFPMLSVSDVRLDTVLDEYMWVAISASTSKISNTQMHRVRDWYMELEDLPFTPVSPGASPTASPEDSPGPSPRPSPGPSPGGSPRSPRSGPTSSQITKMSSSSKPQVGLILGISGAVLGVVALGIAVCLAAKYTACFGRHSGTPRDPVVDEFGEKTYAQQAVDNRYDGEKAPANIRF